MFIRTELEALYNSQFIGHIEIGPVMDRATNEVAGYGLQSTYGGPHVWLTKPRELEKTRQILDLIMKHGDGNLDLPQLIQDAGL